MNKIFTLLKNIFSLDKRALALMRIAVSLVILIDLGIRSTDLLAHYSNEGILPLNVLFDHNWHPWNISIHNISGLWQIQALLFSVSFAFAFLLLFGIKTRLSTFVSWFMLMSIHYRNPLIMQGGDDLLRLILFWGMFLPWGEYYSLERTRTLKKDISFFGIASVGYVIQVFSVYFFSALLKDSPEWRVEGTALYYALSLDQMVFPIGKLLYPYYGLLKILTFSVFYMELFVPFLLFIPSAKNTYRKIAITVIVLFHLGISATLFVGLFFLIGIVSVFGMIPQDWMDRLENKLKLFKHILLRLSNVFGVVHLNLPIAQNVSTKNGYSKIKNGLLSIALLYIITWNFQKPTGIFIQNKLFNGIGHLTGLVQNWGMFAPSVFKDDGWYILEATTIENKVIDINRDGAEVSYEKPEMVVSLIKNDRWRKYSENYLFISNTYMRPYFTELKFREWNDQHPERKIHSLKVIYMKEVTKPKYEYVKPTREVLSIIERPNLAINNEPSNPGR